MVKFEVSKSDSLLIDKIMNRYCKLFVTANKLDVMMDVTAAHVNGCPLKLEQLANAPDFDFFHDVDGIRMHLDRSTGKLKDCFLPRFAL